MGIQLAIKGAQNPLPTFRHMSIVAKRLDGSRCYLVELGRGDIGDPAPPERGIAAPLFSAHVYCGQTVAHLSYC